MVIGLSVAYETWPPIGWHRPFVIGWSKYRLGLPGALLHYGLTWPVGIPTVFQTPVTVPLHSPNGRQLPFGLCKGTVKASSNDCCCSDTTTHVTMETPQHLPAKAHPTQILTSHLEVEKHFKHPFHFYNRDDIYVFKDNQIIFSNIANEKMWHWYNIRYKPIISDWNRVVQLYPAILTLWVITIAASWVWWASPIQKQCPKQIQHSTQWIRPISGTSTAPLGKYRHHIDGLVQERWNSSVLSKELRLSCTNPSRWIPPT